MPSKGTQLNVINHLLVVACVVCFDLSGMVALLKSTKIPAGKSPETCESLLFIYWSMLKSIVGLKYGI